MTYELGFLGFAIGHADRLLIDNSEKEAGQGLAKAYGDLLRAHSSSGRPDAERAALMLLSAGQEMYGECSTGTASKWSAAAEHAERLLGIVPLTKTE